MADPVPQWPAPDYVDGDFTVATPCSLPVLSTPFQHSSEPCILTQDFMQFAKDWAALAFNTPHDSAGKTPDYSAYVLVGESAPTDCGGGVIKWTRTYAKKPTSFSEPGGNYNYTFIGYFGSFGVNVPTITGRDRFTESVPLTITRDFYLIGAGADYATVEEIPAVSEMKYYSGSEDVRVDYIGDNPPMAFSTTPSRTDYEAMIGDPIVVEPSTVSRWLGNIYMCETRTVKAK